MLDPSLIKKPRKRAIRPCLLVLLLIILVILGLLLFKLPVRANDVIFEITNDDEQMAWGRSGSTYVQKIAQEWTPQEESIVSSINSKIWKYNSPTDDVKLSVYTGGDEPEGGEFLAETIVINANIATSDQGIFINFPFESSLTLEKDIKYHFVWTRTGDLDNDNFFASKLRNSGEYDYSQHWNSCIANAGWTTGTTRETSFQVLGSIVYDLKIWGIDPVSGTEITTMDATLTIGYQGFDWAEYKGFSIAFKDERLGTSSNTKIYEAEDLEEDGNGEIEVNLTDFGIDRNGKWYLTGLAFGSHLDIEGGMFLTTRGYIDFWSDELVIDEYYLDVNIVDLPEFYPVSDFDIWYSENVEEFATPTAMAMSMTGFMIPIFQTIGEFNSRAQEMFDTSEAYDRGYALGEVFPLISGYVNSIGIFFGGFPILSFFKYIIILMFGIFLIKAILKFIPFFGK